MASKTKSAFVCNDCGADYRKWQGQCSECNAWNTLSEVRLGPSSRGGVVLRPGFAGSVDSAVKTLSEIALDEIPRISSGTGELDLVLGGGFVPGSCVLLGGEPGAGKSTVLLQTLCTMADSNSALYVTGEESPQHVALPAAPLDLPTDKLEIMAIPSVATFRAIHATTRPNVLDIASIQLTHLHTTPSQPRPLPHVLESMVILATVPTSTR